ncbi:MAG TPA: ABC transporter permease [Bacteroidota bacterium]|nr:ABC transporter permease [Bacteroidota bacterium]
MSGWLESIYREVRESLVMALTAVRTNRLRSTLTLLGIAVGVFSIIAVQTAMGVLTNSIEQGMSQLGVNTFQVQKTPNMRSNDARERRKIRNRKPIRYPQGLLVKERTTLSKAVGLEAWDFGKIVTTSDGRKTNPNVSIAGEDIEGITTNNWTIGDGRLYTTEELNSAKSVAILGSGVVEKLFNNIDPIGQTIRVDGREYSVIGTFEKQGGMLGGNQDNMVIVPLPTFFDVYGKEREIHIMVQSSARETYEDCIEQVRGVMRAARQVSPGAEDDFYIFSNDSVIEQFNSFTKYVRLGILIISGIALLAAGVGIMNIMLVSVTERTREIGIRKAIGARKSNILSQFVLEAIVLSEFGGIVGIIFGILAGNITAIMLKIPPIIPFDWAAIGFIVCSVIGIVFGVYPAWKASNLDPIESLRYE